MSKIIIDIPENFSYTSTDTREDGLVKAVLAYYDFSCKWGFDNMEDHIRIEEDK